MQFWAKISKMFLWMFLLNILRLKNVYSISSCYTREFIFPEFRCPKLEVVLYMNTSYTQMITVLFWLGNVSITFQYFLYLTVKVTKIFFVGLFSTNTTNASFKFLILFIYIYPKSPPRAKCYTRSISKWSLTSLKSEFSFSKASCDTKAKEPNLS